MCTHSQRRRKYWLTVLQTLNWLLLADKDSLVFWLEGIWIRKHPQPSPLFTHRHTKRCFSQLHIFSSSLSILALEHTHTLTSICTWTHTYQPVSGLCLSLPSVVLADCSVVSLSVSVLRFNALLVPGLLTPLEAKSAGLSWRGVLTDFIWFNAPLTLPSTSAEYEKERWRRRREVLTRHFSPLLSLSMHTSVSRESEKKTTGLWKRLSPVLISPPRYHSDPITPSFLSYASFTPPSALSSSSISLSFTLSLSLLLALYPCGGENAVIEFFIQVN